MLRSDDGITLETFSRDISKAAMPCTDAHQSTVGKRTCPTIDVYNSTTDIKGVSTEARQQQLLDGGK